MSNTAVFWAVLLLACMVGCMAAAMAASARATRHLVEFYIRERDEREEGAA